MKITDVFWKYPRLKDIVEAAFGNPLPNDIIISTRAVDDKILTSIPTNYTWRGHPLVLQSSEKVFFLWRDGGILYNAVKPQEVTCIYGLTPEWDSSRFKVGLKGEIIKDAIDRLQDDLLLIVVAQITKKHPPLPAEYRVTLYEP